MRAAVLERFGEPLVVREVPEPVAGPGEALVEVLASCVLPYTADVFSGARKYPLETPVIPGMGGVARVLAVGPDATQLRAGDLVWCDLTVRSRDDAGAGPDITLQGWSSRGDGGVRLARYFHDGAYAEQMVVPLENAIALGRSELTPELAARLASLAVHLVPYGGLVAGGLEPGETVLVSGATGNFGSAAVAVALAMGAARVVAIGRTHDVLAAVHERLGDRVVPAPLTGDVDADQAAMRDAAAGPIDLVLDILPPAAGAAATRTAAMTVREYGRVVLMGGVGMLGGDDLALPYPWLMRNSITVRGQWMLQPHWARRLIALAMSGALPLEHETMATFPLARVNDAVAHAAEHGGPFDRTVLVPG